MYKATVKSLVVGVVASILMQLPFIGLLLALLAAPLMLIAPALGTTGVHVDIGFAWISLNSPFAWAAFIAYFSLLFGLILGLLHLVQTKRLKK